MENKEIQFIPDGRLKVGDHYITDEVAVKTIKDLMENLEQTRACALPFYVAKEKRNFPLRAITTICNVLKIGSKKYEPAAWRSEDTLHHARKAYGHLHAYMFGIKVNNDNEDTLAHALTRLAMAVSVREEKKK